MKFKLIFCLALVMSGLLIVTDAFGTEDWSALKSRNITVRLTGVRRNKQAPFNLVARFVTSDRAAMEFTVEFPAHAADAHAATIMNIIDHSVSWTSYRGKSEWPPLNMDVLLSVPPDTQGVVTNFSKWGIFTVSVPDYLTAHWEGDVVPIDEVIERSARIVVARCLAAGPIKASGLTSVGLEVEHVIKGAETNREFFAEAYGFLREGRSYLVCIGRPQRPDIGGSPVIGSGLLPIMEAGWSSDWDTLSPKEQLAKILSARMLHLGYELKGARTEYERLRKILQASYPVQKLNEPASQPRNAAETTK